jgi:hypothetical protein
VRRRVKSFRTSSFDGRHADTKTPTKDFVGDLVSAGIQRTGCHGQLACPCENRTRMAVRHWPTSMTSSRWHPAIDEDLALIFRLFWRLRRDASVAI